MISLEYFLDEKWYKKNLSKLKTNLFYATLPVGIQSKFNWKFKENVFADRFLFDYLNAYHVDQMEHPYRGFRYFDIISMILVDGDLKDSKSATVLYKDLVQLNNDRLKPNSYDLKLMRNILQVYDLIYQDNFPLNEENFELVAHILFQGLDHSLDSLDDLKRTNKTKTNFKNLLDAALIDVEMKNLWNYLKRVQEPRFSGFTEALMLGIEFLYISPFRTLNIIMMQFIIKWYLFQLGNDFVYMNFAIALGVNFAQFIAVTDELFATDFNCDHCFALLRSLAKNQTNMTKRFWWMANNVKQPPEFKKELEANDLRLFMCCLMMLPAQFSDEMAHDNAFVNAIFEGEKDISTKLNALANFGVLEKKRQENKVYYVWNNPDYKKINELLVDDNLLEK